MFKLRQMSLCKFVQQSNRLKHEWAKTNVFRRSNFLRIVLVTGVSAWPTDSDSNPTDTPLQVAHNNKGGKPRIGCSRLVRCNQMLRSKTACRAAIWHGEIRLDEIHFKVQRPAYCSIQSATFEYEARGGVLRHGRWHTCGIVRFSKDAATFGNQHDIINTRLNSYFSSSHLFIHFLLE